MHGLYSFLLGRSPGKVQAEDNANHCKHKLHQFHYPQQTTQLLALHQTQPTVQLKQNPILIKHILLLNT